jgi:nucleoside-diphosphate-sugar epimerase
MNVLIFGASGMVGQGVLRECLLDPGIDRVTIVGRSATGQSHGKLRGTHPPRPECHRHGRGRPHRLRCLLLHTVGVTSVGLSEADYTRLTYDLTLKVAGALAPLNPQMTFLYVTGRAPTPPRRAGSCGRASRDERRMR